MAPRGEIPEGSAFRWPKSVEEFRVGEVARISHVVAEDDVTAFVALTGDDNPVHLDEEFARGVGAGGRVVHGMLAAGFVSALIGTRLPGPGALWLSQTFNFRRPVRVGDEIEVVGEVVQKSPGTGLLGIDISVLNQHGVVVLDGRARVQVLARVNPVEAVAPPETVVVTGAGSGIGSAIAEQLAADGLAVVVNCRTNEEGARGVVDRITAAGGRATMFQADVTAEGQVEALFEFAATELGRVDALVNNAGGPMLPEDLSDLSWTRVQEHLDSHLRGSFLCAQAVLGGMRERNAGRIVNIASAAGFGVPPARMTGYSVAKAAVAALTRSMAVEVGPQNVTVNCVAPGLTETAMTQDVPQRTKLATAATTPLRRIGSASDVADIVSFLLGPGGSYVTGQSIHVDGGQFMS